MRERIALAALVVSQHGLRYAAEHLYGMMDFVAAGGLWSEDALRQYAARHGRRPGRLIQLSLFPGEASSPGPLVVHDGHHRLVATHLAGRAFLEPAEYQVTAWTYADYLAINFTAGWVTPFDPRSHVRTADFESWKQRVLAVAAADQAAAEQMICEQSAAYREPRRYGSIAALAGDCCGLELGRWQQRRGLTPGRVADRRAGEGGD
jgi:hypothetical protein